MTALRIGRRMSPLVLACAVAAAGAAIGTYAASAQTVTPDWSQPSLLPTSLRSLKIARLSLPQPIGTGVGPGLADSAPVATDTGREAAAPEAAFDPQPLPFPTLVRPEAYVALALDTVLALPGIDDVTYASEDGPSYGPDIASLDAPELEPSDGAGGNLDGAEAEVFAREAAGESPEPVDLTFADPATPGGDTDLTGGKAPLHQPEIVFGRDPSLFPPQAFEHMILASLGPVVPLPVAKPDIPAEDEAAAPASGHSADGADQTPAVRLSLAGAERARAEKCLAEAIYFESRGEPKRGQVAVAQVVMNRVFSGYYPKDVCKTVYQNAHRKLACQFTFACDNVRDVVREPDMWVQAKEIASDMLDGKLWLSSVGRATHYHAYWVRPSWVREMRKLDRIGVHTFYRPRRWEG